MCNCKDCKWLQMEEESRFFKAIHRCVCMPDHVYIENIEGYGCGQFENKD